MTRRRDGSATDELGKLEELRHLGALCAFGAVSLAACASSHRSIPQPTPPVDAGAGDALPDAEPEVDAPDGATCEASAAGVPTFEKRALDAVYRAEGAGVLDVNNDGRLDVVTDQYWYEGPALTPHEIRAPVTFNIRTQYADVFGVYPRDLDGDGFLDIIVAPHPTFAMYWYRNPGGARDAHWTPHLIAPEGVAGLETPTVVDLFRDGSPPVLLMTDSATHALGWYEPPSDPTLPWVLHPIATEASGYSGWQPFAHGLGVGDVDGDGLLDVLTGYGWFQQTKDRATWSWHRVGFGPDPRRACSRMFTYDFDGDGLADILCARPHDYGIYWYQQHPGAGGADPTFAPHLIDDTLSEMHAVRFEDLDGDGVPEIVSGKRWLALGSDPGTGDPPLLVEYVMRGAGTSAVTFERHVIDDDSGVGSTFAIGDLDGDCKPDIVTGNKKGLFFFRQR